MICRRTIRRGLPPRRHRRTVLLDAATETDFLAHALRATQKLPDAGFDPATLPDGAWPLDTAVVLRNGLPSAAPRLQRLDQFCDAGGALWIFVDGSAAQRDWLQQHGVRVAARLPADEPWHLRDWDAEHPALAAFAGQSLLPLSRSGILSRLRSGWRRARAHRQLAGRQNGHCRT